MPLRVQRAILSNQTNMEVDPAHLGKKQEVKRAFKPQAMVSTNSVVALGPSAKTATLVQAKQQLPAAKPATTAIAKPTPMSGATPAVVENDEFYCTSYVEDIYSYLMECEQRQCYTLTVGFLDHQFRITANNRRVLVDWLVKVHQKFNLQHETLFIAVDTLDRYLQV